MTVEENLLMGAFLRAPWRERRAALRRVYSDLPAVELKRAQRARTLSGGERRLVGLGRGMMRPARILLIDEPSLGLAPVAIEAVYAAIARLKRESGATIVLVEENFTTSPPLPIACTSSRPARSSAAAARRRVAGPYGGRDVSGIDRGGRPVTDVVAILSNGVVYGSIYGLVAIGMTLIYGTMRILDMSQGSMVMIGSYVGWWALTSHGVNAILALALALWSPSPSAWPPSSCRCSR